MRDKYVCPECGGQLEFWKEYVHDKQQLVNMKTGLLNKKVYYGSDSELGTSGLRCIECGFMYSGSSENKIEYDILNEIFEKTWD